MGLPKNIWRTDINKMTTNEENRRLKDLISKLYACIPHDCYNCAYFEEAYPGEQWCHYHNAKTIAQESCSLFELKNWPLCQNKRFRY